MFVSLPLLKSYLNPSLTHKIYSPYYSFSRPTVWNFIGGVGFALCGALGYGSVSKSGVLYQSTLCTFWGSWAFLIGSVLQWYESVNGVQ